MTSWKQALFAAAVLAPRVLGAPVAGLNARTLVVETVTETDWVTLDVTATVWINDADPTAAPSTAPLVTPTSIPAMVTPSISSVSVVPVAAPSTPSSSSVAAATPTPAPTPSTSSVQIPASSASIAAAVVPTVSPAAFAAQQPTTTSVYVPPTSAATSAPAAVTSSVSTQQASSASTSGTCEGPNNACVGDVTHYDGGLGACGWNVATDSDLAVALPFGFMGTLSNSNPLCGRTITLLNPTSGKTVQAKVSDKCMGCVDRAIDLTNALFNAIVPGGDGRVHGIEWWLN